MKSLNYTALSKPLGYSQAKAIVTNQDNKYKLVIGVFMFFLIVMSIALSRSLDRPSMPLPFFTVVVVIVSVMAIVYVNHRRQTIRAAKIITFAQDNGLKSNHNKSIDTEGREGIVFNDGWQRMVMESFTVPQDKSDIEIGSYRYVTGRGRSARSWRFTYITMPHALVMPSLYFDSRRKPGIGFFSRNLKGFIHKSQKISNLNSRSYNVYAPLDWQSKILDTLKQGGVYDLDRLNGIYDFEITRNTIVAYSRGSKDLSKQEAVEKTIQDATMIRAFFDTWLAKLAVDSATKTDDNTLILRPSKPIALYVILAIMAISIVVGIIIR